MYNDNSNDNDNNSSNNNANAFSVRSAVRIARYLTFPGAHKKKKKGPYTVRRTGRLAGWLAGWLVGVYGGGHAGTSDRYFYASLRLRPSVRKRRVEGATERRRERERERKIRRRRARRAKTMATRVTILYYGRARGPRSLSYRERVTYGNAECKFSPAEPHKV